MGSGLPFTVVGYPSLSNPCQEENAMAEMRKKLDRVSNSAIIGMAVPDGGWGAQMGQSEDKKRTRFSWPAVP